MEGTIMELAAIVGMLSLVFGAFQYFEQRASSKRDDEFQRQVTKHLETIAANTSPQKVEKKIPSTNKRRNHMQFIAIWSGVLMLLLVLLFSSYDIQLTDGVYMV